MHINKCAGTSIHQFFKTNEITPTHGPRNSGEHLIITKHDKLWNNVNITNLTTVRNPYNRVYSIYKQWYFNGWLRHEEPFTVFVDLLPLCYQDGHTKRVISDTFYNKLKVRSKCPEELCPIGVRMIKPCSFWVNDIERFKIFKVEEIDELENYFTSKGFEITTSINSIKAPVTVTDGEPCYLDKYDKRQIDIVNELFDEDFKNFGYQKV
tara:strand:+ start:26061 stop:26687 length:627 start_codon:yes stop_codon:yes gene_type:complete